jgi:hypothetical protein
MKKKNSVERIIIIILLLFVGGFGYYLTDELLRTRKQNEFLSTEKEKLNHQLDSVRLRYDSLEAHKEIEYVEIEKWNTKYDTIIEEVKLLPADSLVGAMDALTGDSLDLSYLWEDNAIVSLPRIENIVVGLYEKEKLEGLVVKLYSVIDLEKAQKRELYATIDLKNGHIAIRDAVIVEQNGEIRHLKKVIFTERAVGAGIILFLMALLL